ncbi:MAG: guanylate kinase [Syntrophobacterales bacterium]|nr:guanylate kinase [Syntrophobacterales bacterium]
MSKLPRGTGLFLVVSAPSGTGKTSIYKELMKQCPHIQFSISHTSRPPRRGEVHGRDYFFVSRDEFDVMIQREEFVEWAENYGQLYGTSRAVLETLAREGDKDVILDVDPLGAKAIKDRYPQAVFVFILPPSFEELKRRLTMRGQDDEETISTRFNHAMVEINEIGWYDYVVFNDDLPDAVSLLCSIYRAEKNRVMRKKTEINKFINGR